MPVAPDVFVATVEKMLEVLPDRGSRRQHPFLEETI